MPSERIDNGRQTVEAESTGPNNTVDEMDGQEATEEDAAAQLKAEDGHWPEDEGNNLVMTVSLQGERIRDVFYSEGCYCYFSGGLYGYLAEDGSEIAPCIYSEAMPFSEGLAVVREGGFCGVIGNDGREILLPQYDSVSLEETCITAQKEGLYYVFDREGEELIAAEWVDIFEDYKAEGLYRIWRDKKWGLAEGGGEILLEPAYKYMDLIRGYMEAGHLGKLGRFWRLLRRRGCVYIAGGPGSGGKFFPAM